jgi:PAS domain S-box-containing protein
MASKTSEKVSTKQLDMLYRQLPFGLLGTVIISGLVFIFLSDFPDKNALQIWVTLLFLVVLFRAFSTALYYNEKNKSLFRIKKFETLFIAGVVLGGLSWGILGCWLYPMTTTASNQMIIFVVLVGVAGGATTSLSYRRLPIFLFVSLTLLPLLFGLNHTPDNQVVFFQLALILYTIFLLRNALVFQRNNEQILLLKEKALAEEDELRGSQKESEANALYLDSVLQSSTETAIIATDTDFRIKYFNTKAGRMFGMDKTSDLGKNFLEMHTLQDKDKKDVSSLNHVSEKLQETGSYEFSMTVGTKSIGIQINTIRDHTDNFTGFLLLANDITIRQKTEEKLVKAQQQAEAANLAKSAFLANVCHDIKTPIIDIIGMTDLALETELTLRQQEYLENIKHSTDGFLDLLNDILDFSTMEAGQLVIQKHDFNLLDLLDNILSRMTFTANEKGLKLAIQNDVPDLAFHIKGDELRLQQILTNLIGNSIKFTEKGSVTLKVTHEVKVDNKVEFHFMVIDTGIGILAEQQETLFSSFTQVDSSITRKLGDTSLGLAICKQLVELMDGKIWFENNTEQGGTFHFTVGFTRGKEIINQPNDATVALAE